MNEEALLDEGLVKLGGEDIDRSLTWELTEMQRDKLT